MKRTIELLALLAGVALVVFLHRPTPQLAVDGVRLGDSETQVRDLLGPPDYAEHRLWAYDERRELQFGEDGRVRSISGLRLSHGERHFDGDTTEAELTALYGPPQRIDRPGCGWAAGWRDFGLFQVNFDPNNGQVHSYTLQAR
ncbi:MAG: hypothetical protein AB7S38_17435 [Vulcanimicrobiota bacterium]